jgi:hypothetical protein
MENCEVEVGEQIPVVGYGIMCCLKYSVLFLVNNVLGMFKENKQYIFPRFVFLSGVVV